MTINVVQSGSFFAVSATGSFFATWLNGNVISVDFPTNGLFEPLSLYFPPIQVPVSSTISSPTVSGSNLYVQNQLVGPDTGQYLTFGQFLFVFPIKTISVNLLDSHAAYKPLFSPLPITDTLFYDDGPVTYNRVNPTQSDLSSSLNNLSSSYPFVQGVEMTKQAQYDAGLVKIWSGDPQHQLKPCVFGQDKNFFPNPGFADLELFDPVKYLQSQEIDSPLYFNLLTYPIITGDNDQAENYNFNGIIEPFPIRPIIAFFSTDAPFEAHGIRAEIVGGNDDQLFGNDRVLTVDYFEPTQQIVGYLDMVDILNPGSEISGSFSSGSWSGGVPHSGTFVPSGVFSASFIPTGTPLNGFFRYEFTNILPFSDTRLVRNTLPNDDEEQDDMINALSLMTGSTDNYVRFDEVSATCGWYYDNTVSIGTDSLSFGGMTY